MLPQVKIDKIKKSFSTNEKVQTHLNNSNTCFLEAIKTANRLSDTFGILNEMETLLERIKLLAITIDLDATDLKGNKAFSDLFKFLK